MDENRLRELLQSVEQSDADALIEAAFAAALQEMETPDGKAFVAAQLNAIRGFFLRTKGWTVSTARDREYFESGWSSGYAKCMFDMVQGKIDVGSLLIEQHPAAQEVADDSQEEERNDTNNGGI